jgi:hypothetical protein
MENWRLNGLVEAARNLAAGLENMAKEQVEASPPPTPGAEEHSPGVAEMEQVYGPASPPLPDWWRRLNQLEERLQAVEEHLSNYYHQWPAGWHLHLSEHKVLGDRILALEGGRPDASSPTRPSPICGESLGANQEMGRTPEPTT